MTSENEGLGPLPQIHPRERLVDEAEQQLRMSLISLHKLGLTTGEFLQVVSNVLGGEVRSIARYAIRVERHGNTETPGGWAS